MSVRAPLPDRPLPATFAELVRRSRLLNIFRARRNARPDAQLLGHTRVGIDRR